MMKIAPSSTRRLRLTSMLKSMWPGVSMMLMRCVFPLARHRGGGDRDAALPLLLHIVGRGVAVVHLADLVRHTRVIQDPLGRRGLPRVDMRGDTDVSNSIERRSRHGEPPINRANGRAYQKGRVTHRWIRGKPRAPAHGAGRTLDRLCSAGNATARAVLQVRIRFGVPGRAALPAGAFSPVPRSQQPEPLSQSVHSRMLYVSAWTFAPLRLSCDSGLAAVAANRCHPIRRRGCCDQLQPARSDPAWMIRRPRPRVSRRCVKIVRQSRRRANRGPRALYQGAGRRAIGERGDHPCPVPRAAGLVLDQPFHRFAGAGPVRRRRGALLSRKRSARMSPAASRTWCWR